MKLTWKINEALGAIDFGRQVPLTGNEYELELVGIKSDKTYNFYVASDDVKTCLAASKLGEDGVYRIHFKLKALHDVFAGKWHEVRTFHVIASDGENVVAESDLTIGFVPANIEPEDGEIHSFRGPKGSSVEKFEVVEYTSDRDAVIRVYMSDKTTHDFIAPRGLRGYSEYELAVQEGYTGTLAEWLSRFETMWRADYNTAEAQRNTSFNAAEQARQNTFNTNEAARNAQTSGLVNQVRAAISNIPADLPAWENINNAASLVNENATKWQTALDGFGKTIDIDNQQISCSNGHIDNRGTSFVSGSARVRCFPVKKGDVVVFIGNKGGVGGSPFALLKSAGTFVAGDSISDLGQWMDGEFNVRMAPSNLVVKIKIPQDGYLHYGDYPSYKPTSITLYPYSVLGDRVAEVENALDSMLERELVKTNAPSASNYLLQNNGTFSTAGGTSIFGLEKGDKLIIDGRNDFDTAIALLNRPYRFNSGDDINSVNAWMNGESAPRVIKVGSHTEIDIPEDGYLYVKSGTGTDFFPTIRVTRSSKQFSRILDELDKVREEIPPSSKISSLADFTPPRFGSYYREELGCAQTTASLDGYSSTYVNNSTRVTLISGVEYGYFADIEVITDDPDREGWSCAVACYANTNRGTSKRRILINKRYKIFVGSLLGNGLTSNDNRVAILEIRNAKGGHPAVTKTSIDFRVYGVYVMPMSEITDTSDEFAAGIDYSKTSTTNVMYADKSSLASFAEVAYNADNAELADKANTILRGNAVVVLGDSLAAQMDCDMLPEYLGCKLYKYGFGGYYASNTTSLPFGFCEPHFLSLFPKDVKLVVFYGGANDGFQKIVTSQTTGKQRLGVDEDKLGTMLNDPVSIGELLKYRLAVYKGEKGADSGKTDTFIKAYKSTLHNIHLLFPNAKILCVTQHRIYHGYVPMDLDEKYPNMGLYTPTGVSMHTPDNATKRQTILDIADEYSCHTLDFMKLSGVSDHNYRDFLIIEPDGSTWVHPAACLKQIEGGLVLDAVLHMGFHSKYTKVTPNNKSEGRVELNEWLLDLREGDEPPMTLVEAIEAFNTHFTDAGIEFKQGMYMVYRGEDRLHGYFLDDPTNPTSESAWLEWLPPSQHMGTVFQA